MSTAEGAASPRRPSLDSASGAIRNAVRDALAQVSGAAHSRTTAQPDNIEWARPRVIVAVSGGADSMALLHACAFLHRRGEITATAVTVDHNLQPTSAEVAHRVTAAAESWGVPTEIAGVSITAGDEGLEAAARTARYAALDAARTEHESDWVLTAHTRNDQAETVLLGLMRGSGTRSLAGMALRTGHIVRPLLDIERATTEESCRAQGIAVWNDPMNADDAYARVRVRTLLPVLEAELDQPITDNLARTAELCRADADLIDRLAEPHIAELRGRTEVGAEELADLDEAILTRVVRGWLVSLGVPAQSFGVTRVSELCTLIRRAAVSGRVAQSGRAGQPGHTRGRLSLPGDTEVIVDSHGITFRRDAKSR